MFQQQFWQVILDDTRQVWESVQPGHQNMKPAQPSMEWLFRVDRVVVLVDFDGVPE